MAMVPPSLTYSRRGEELPAVLPVLSRFARLVLVGISLGLTAVFVVAWRLDPYRGGRTWQMETHTQLGLPPCHFKLITGLPCPSCGMSTSFALLVRGDVVHSLRANSVGTLLAVMCLALIPWCLITAARGQPLWIASMERALTALLIAFLWLTLTRWGVVLGLLWWNGLV